MNVLVECGKCHRKLSVKMRSVGKKVRCPNCRSVFPVQPAAPEDETESEVSAHEVSGGDLETEPEPSRNEPEPSYSEPEPSRGEPDYMSRQYTFSTPMLGDRQFDEPVEELPRRRPPPRREKPPPSKAASILKWTFTLTALVALVFLIRNQRYLLHYFADPRAMGWREIPFAELNFQIDAPGSFAKLSQTDAKSHDYEILFPKQEILFTVRVRELVNKMSDEFTEEEKLLGDADKMVREEWDGLVVKNQWGKSVVPEQVVTRVAYGEHFGMDYRFHVPDENVRIFRRFYIVRGRLYLVGADIKDDQYWMLADRYVKSFRLTSVPAGVRLKNERKGKLPPSVVQIPSVTPQLMLRGHQRPISMLSFSGDGTKLLSGARNDFLLKWDLATTLGASVASTEHFRFLTVDPVPNRLVTLNTDLKDPSHDLTYPFTQPDHLKTGPLPNLEILNLTGTATSQIQFSGDGNRFVAPLANHLTYWDLIGMDDKPELLWKQATKHLGIHCAALSRDGRKAATGGFLDGDIILWDTVSRQPIKKFEAHKVKEVKYLPAEEAKETKEAKDPKEKKELKKKRVDLEALKWTPPGVRGLAFSRDGQFLVSAGHDGVVHMWKVDGAPDSIRSFKKFEMSAPVDCMEISNAGHWLALGCSDGTIELISIEIASTRTRFRIADTTGPITALRFSADERTLAVACEICEGAYGTYLFEVNRLPPIGLR